MKKLTAILLSILLLIPILSIPATAKETEDNTSSIPQLSQKQFNILRSLGVSANEIPTLTTLEIGQILIKNEVVNPEYLAPYLPTEAQLAANDAIIQRKLESAAKKYSELNLSSSDIAAMIQSGAADLDSITSKSASEMAAIKRQSQTYRINRAAPSNTFTKFLTGSRYLKYYNGDSCYIHRDALSTSYAANATSAHYNEMNKNVARALAIAGLLYNKTIGQSNTQIYSYNLWGDRSNDGSLTHQGLDFTIKEGSDIYSLAPGKVVGYQEYKGGDTITIENKAYGLRFIYMHTKNITPEALKCFKDKSNISAKVKIAQQGRFIDAKKKINNTHVHFEVTTKNITNGNTDTDYTVHSSNPYIAGLYFQD